jgi:cell fate (sporulation/competence/biofilm development) regulator YlbF (YheA/YmcA/DUF963 family)
VYQNVLDISDQLADGIRNSEEIEKAKSDLQLLQSSQFSIADFFISFLSPDAFDDENLPRHYRIFDWLLSRDVVWKMYDIITCAESILKEHALIRSIPLQEEDICIFMAETIRDVFPPPHAGRERLERIAFSKMTVALAQACKISPNWEITEALRRSLEAEDNAEPLLTDHFSLLSSHHKGCWVIDIILESTKIRFMK